MDKHNLEYVAIRGEISVDHVDIVSCILRIDDEISVVCCCVCEPWNCNNFIFFIKCYYFVYMIGHIGRTVLIYTHFRL